MVVGILATALGAILIGFGIPINEFSLGNTLILAGTVTAMGGLIVLAVSRAVSQLARIADLLATRPMSAPGAPVVSGTAPMAAPMVPPVAPRAPQRAQGDDFGLPETVEPVRSPPRVAPAAEEPVAAPPPAQRSGWRPPRPFADRGPKPAAVPEPRRAGAGADNPFDTAWPDKAAAPQRREPAIEVPAEPAAGGGRPEAVSVLKSGVVDGMAYTLYTDGSIEAELAQGVVRFGSIEELRNHLEKSA
jgi:hypothetical protein